MSRKSLITSLTLCLALLSTSAIAYGPGQFPPSGRAGGPDIERMSIWLDLTPSQQEQLRKVFKEQQDKRLALREETQNRVRDVLTPEQIKRWEAMQAMRDQRRQNRMLPPPAGNY